MCIVRHGSCYVLVESRSQTLVGEISAFSFQGCNEYDNTRSLRIKQSDGKYVRFGYAGTSFIVLEKQRMSLL